MANLALVDDHVLLRNGLAELVRNLGYTVLFEADNGNACMNKLANSPELPELILLDINMPIMDGYETAQKIRLQYPDIKILALSMYDHENAIIRMLKSGARGYILKDADPFELKNAITDVLSKGFYYSELISGKLLHAIHNMNDEGGMMQNGLQLNNREIDFLKYTCSELTYKEIAEKMFVSPRTIDGYRDALFEKLGLKTRVGLVMYAIKNGVVTIN